MDVYHIWCRLKPGVRDMEFADAATAYFDHAKAEGKIEGYRILRRKLGLGHPNLFEWNIQLEFNGLAQMDDAFSMVASRSDPMESFHHAVNSKVEEVIFGLYRDFPDDFRQRGNEKF